MRDDEINEQNMSLNNDSWIIMVLEKQKVAVPLMATGGASFLSSAKSHHKARAPLGRRESALMMQSQGEV